MGTPNTHSGTVASVSAAVTPTVRMLLLPLRSKHQRMHAAQHGALNPPWS